MRVGRVELGWLEIRNIRTYLLKGLAEGGDEAPYSWPISGKVVVGTDGLWRIVEGTTRYEVIFDYPWLKLPAVPLSPDLPSDKRTTWLQIAIAIADQIGLTDDSEVMGAIERRITEEVLEGRMTGEGVGSRSATTEGGRAVRRFAWSPKGQLAAEVAGTWRLPNGEAVGVVDHTWAIVEL